MYLGHTVFKYSILSAVYPDLIARPNPQNVSIAMCVYAIYR